MKKPDEFDYIFWGCLLCLILSLNIIRMKINIAYEDAHNKVYNAYVEATQKEK